MTKKYILTESQLNQLIERKRKNKNIAENIILKTKTFKKALNESKHQKNAVLSLLENYKKKGLLNKKVIDLIKESELIKDELIEMGLINS